MSEHASVRFLISNSADFYKWAGKYVHRRTRDEAIAEARRSVAPPLAIYDTIKSICENLVSAGQYLAAIALKVPRAELLAVKVPRAELLAVKVPSAADLAVKVPSAADLAMKVFRAWSASVEEEGNTMDEDDVCGDVKSDQVDAVSDDQTTELEGTP